MLVLKHYKNDPLDLNTEKKNWIGIIRIVMKHFKNGPHVLKHWQKRFISMMIVVKHYKTDLLLWNTDKTTCTLENTTENEPLCSVQHYRLVLEYGRVWNTSKTARSF